MQYSIQKGGRLGLRDTAAQRWLRGARLAQAVEHSSPELPDVIGAAIGQRKLGGVPGGFDRIEYRGL
jgi:hypothetical protein